MRGAAHEDVFLSILAMSTQTQAASRDVSLGGLAVPRPAPFLYREQSLVKYSQRRMR